MTEQPEIPHTLKTFNSRHGLLPAGRLARYHGYHPDDPRAARRTDSSVPSEQFTFDSTLHMLPKGRVARYHPEDPRCGRSSNPEVHPEQRTFDSVQGLLPEGRITRSVLVALIIEIITLMFTGCRSLT